jgi:hypothetical protein
MQFGDDWPGVFIRGDNAAYYAMCLRSVLNCDAGPIERANVEDLAATLEASRVPAKGVQMMAAFESAAKGEPIARHDWIEWCLSPRERYLVRKLPNGAVDRVDMRNWKALTMDNGRAVEAEWSVVVGDGTREVSVALTSSFVTLHALAVAVDAAVDEFREQQHAAGRVAVSTGYQPDSEDGE